LGGSVQRIVELLVKRWGGLVAVGVHHSGLTSAFSARQGQRTVLVWGVQTPAEVKLALQHGAAAVIADDPGMARRALNIQDLPAG
jgi:glycerophosphoryl diester phosphodiesterase